MKETEALNQLSIQQTEVLTSLSRLEANIKIPNGAFAPILDFAAAEDDPTRREIIEHLWSTSDLPSAPISQVRNPLAPVDTSPAGSESISARLIDSHQARLARNEARSTLSQSYAVAIANSLRFRDVKHREEAIPEAYKKTFEWIYATPRTDGETQTWVGFTPWLEGSAREAYWITGKPGAGKSTLMKFVTQDPRTHKLLLSWSGDRPLIMASFYFWSAGASRLQKSQTGLLRALLLQCLEQMQSLCPKICPRRWALLKIFGNSAMQEAPHWTWKELIESFSALTLLMGAEFNLALFIDGLDEFDGDHQALIDFINLFHCRKGAKILISSRPENVFLDAFSANPSLRMEDFTNNDIQTFVQGEFSRTRGHDELTQANPVEADRLMTEIVEKAKCVFLWVSVVVRALREGLTEGDSLKELRSLLKQLPTDLSELYSSIWLRIKPEYRTHSSRLFQIHHCSTTVLDAVTLHLADMDDEETMGQDIVALTGRAREHITKTLVRRLNSRTRGLLEVSKDGQVDYLHRSVRDWVLAKWDDICSESREEFDPHLALLKALTIEMADPGIWADSGLGFPSKFWNRVFLCFHHACNVRDEPTTSSFLVTVLDRLDLELGKISTHGNYADGRLHLYRDVAYDSLLPTSTLGLPHWASTQYTQTPDRLANTFTGLTAQFAVLPYVRDHITRDPKLLRKPNPENITILSCAILGPEHFCRPDVTDLAGRYIRSASWESRLQLVRLLLEQGALVADMKMDAETIKKQARGRAAGPVQVRTLYEQMQRNRQFILSVTDADQSEKKYWESVVPLFESYMLRNETLKLERSPLWRFVSRITSRGRGGERPT